MCELSRVSKCPPPSPLFQTHSECSVPRGKADPPNQGKGSQLVYNADNIREVKRELFVKEPWRGLSFLSLRERVPALACCRYPQSLVEHLRLHANPTNRLWLRGSCISDYQLYRVSCPPPYDQQPQGASFPFEVWECHRALAPYATLQHIRIEER